LVWPLYLAKGEARRWIALIVRLNVFGCYYMELGSM
jgi:hypothetical protein